MLAVGLGLEKAGSVELIVNALTPLLRDIPPWGLVFAVYALSVLLTEMITNNAVAIIVTPVVIALARDLGVDPRPLVIAVMFAASASFATPIGYQTNTLVYAAGNYRFRSEEHTSELQSLMRISYAVFCLKKKTKKYKKQHTITRN